MIIMREGFRIFLSILTTYCIFQQCNGKIIREGNEFLGQFTLVESDQRIKHNCIRNITKNTTLQECCKECLKEKRCQSFNRHRDKGFCELLAISKFNETGLLQKNENWVHYETDDDEKNVGRMCINLSPCQPYEICEDTLKPDPAYQCRCRDGFEGKKCQDYKGPGTKKGNPAASCKLLLMKFKNIPDGEYWFEGESKMKRCERKVDGGLTPWSLFGPCNFKEGKCGTQKRNRSCTNPPPKGGGRSCDYLGHQEESKPCTDCNDKCSYNLINNTAFKLERELLLGTFSKMLSEYTMRLELKVNVSDLVNGTRHNIIFITNEEKRSYGFRNPAVSIRQKHGSNPVLIVAVEVPPNKYGTHYSIQKDKNSFDNKWVKIEILQRKLSNGNYVFEVFFDGDREHFTAITEPKEYENIRFWMAAFNAVIDRGYVRNLYLEGFCDLNQPS